MNKTDKAPETPVKVETDEDAKLADVMNSTGEVAVPVETSFLNVVDAAVVKEMQDTNQTKAADQEPALDPPGSKQDIMITSPPETAPQLEALVEEGEEVKK